MTVWSIGLAFLVFWSIGAVGLCIVLTSLIRLRQSRPFSRRRLSEVRAISAGDSALAVMNALLLLLGLALVFEGFWLTYSTIFR